MNICYINITCIHTHTHMIIWLCGEFWEQEKSNQDGSESSYIKRMCRGMVRFDIKLLEIFSGLTNLWSLMQAEKVGSLIQESIKNFKMAKPRINPSLGPFWALCLLYRLHIHKAGPECYHVRRGTWPQQRELALRGRNYRHKGELCNKPVREDQAQALSVQLRCPCLIWE